MESKSLINVEISRTVKVYMPVTIQSAKPGELPKYVIQNSTEELIWPNKWPSTIYLSSGEKTLVLYELTSQGLEVINKIEKERNLNNEVK